MKKVVGICIFLLFGLLQASSQEVDSIRRQPYVELIYHSGIFWSRTENLQEQFDQGYRAFGARIAFRQQEGKHGTNSTDSPNTVWGYTMPIW